MKRVGCVLVVYNPDFELLSKVIESIINQVDKLFISDNSDSSDINFFNNYKEKVIYHFMGSNAGIAKAQNVGICYFISENFDYIFFLDDDSILQDSIVSKMLKLSDNLVSNNVFLGGVGARPFNRQNGKKYVTGASKEKKYDKDIFEVAELMNSASMIPVRLFSEAGLFDESLFIDGVDHEWCWRAYSITKCRFFILDSATISHMLGKGDKFLLIRDVAIPPPSRTYYQFRNYFILLRRKYVPLKWKAINGIKYLVKMVYFPLFLKPRKEYLFNILKGINDGILNKTLK